MSRFQSFQNQFVFFDHLLKFLPAQSRRSRAARRVLPTALVLAVSLALIGAPVCAQPIFEAVGTSAPGPAAATLTIPVPASTQGMAVGDLLVAVVAVEINPATTFPSGWTAVPGHGGFNGATCTSDGDPPGINCQMSVYWKFSDGTETDVQVSFGVLRESAGAVLRYSGTDAAAPIGPIASQNGFGDATAPAVATTQDNTLVLRVATADTNPGPGGDTQTPPLSGPPNERFSLQSNISQVNAVTVQVAGSDIVQPLAGSTGTATWTGGGGNWVASTIGIRPAGGASSGADLSISKNDGRNKVKPGQSLTYTIVAANAGPDDVQNAVVNDMFPGAFGPNGAFCSWTCSGSAGGVCTPFGGGDIFDNVDLPAGADVTYTVNCDVDCGARGTIVNTATITAPGGVVDPTPANNNATDTTEVNTKGKGGPCRP